MKRNGSLAERNRGKKTIRTKGVPSRMRKKKTKTNNLNKLAEPKNIRTSLKEFSPELIKLSKWLRAVRSNRGFFNVSRLQLKGLIVKGPKGNWRLTKKGERILRTLFKTGF